MKNKDNIMKASGDFIQIVLTGILFLIKNNRSQNTLDKILKCYKIY